jgi:hypothetical protein
VSGVSCVRVCARACVCVCACVLCVRRGEKGGAQGPAVFRPGAHACAGDPHTPLCVCVSCTPARVALALQGHRRPRRPLHPHWALPRGGDSAVPRPHRARSHAALLGARPAPVAVRAAHGCCCLLPTACVHAHPCTAMHSHVQPRHHTAPLCLFALNTSSYCDPPPPHTHTHNTTTTTARYQPDIDQHHHTHTHHLHP